AAGLADEPQVGGGRGAGSAVPQPRGVLAGKQVDRLRAPGRAKDAFAGTQCVLVVDLLDVDTLARESPAALLDPQDGLLRWREGRPFVELHHGRRTGGEKKERENRDDVLHVDLGVTSLRRSTRLSVGKSCVHNATMTSVPMPPIVAAGTAPSKAA